MDYILVAEKFVIGMMVMILQINVLGKYEFSNNTPLNQIQNYVLGGIIGGVIFNKSITLLQFFIVLLIWSLIVIMVKLLGESSRHIQAALEGKPQLLVYDGIVDVALCTQLGLSAEQLAWRLREEGIASVGEVAAAVMEPNGKLTVLRRGGDGPWFPAICDGHVDDTALSLIGRDRAWLTEQLESQGIESPAEVFLGEIVDGGLVVVPYPDAQTYTDIACAIEDRSKRRDRKRTKERRHH